MISSAALATALPPTSSPREPPWPPPVAVTAVSACRKRIASMASPSLPASTCGSAVSCPMPVEWLPTASVTRPSAPNVTLASSLGAPPVHLQIGRHGDAAPHPARLGLGGARGKARVVGELKRALEQGREIARVDR